MHAAQFLALSASVLAACSLGATAARSQPRGGLDRLISETTSLQQQVARLSDGGGTADLAPLLNQLQLVQTARMLIGTTDREMALRPYLDRELRMVESLARAGRYPEAERKTEEIMGIIRADQRVNIEIVSEPTRANATFLYVGREKARELVTDEVAQGIAVGEYTLEVARSGYKTGTTSLDLLRETVVKVTCTLARESDPEQSYCHKPSPSN